MDQDDEVEVIADDNAASRKAKKNARAATKRKYKRQPDPSKPPLHTILIVPVDGKPCSMGERTMLVSFLSEVCMEKGIVCCAQHETATFVSLSLRDEEGGEAINEELKKQEIGDRLYQVKTKTKYNPNIKDADGVRVQRCFVTLKKGVPVDWDGDRLLQSLIKLNHLPGTAQAPRRFSNNWQNITNEALAFVPCPLMEEELVERAKKKEGLFLGLAKCYYKIGNVNSGVRREKKPENE